MPATVPSLAQTAISCRSMGATNSSGPQGATPPRATKSSIAPNGTGSSTVPAGVPSATRSVVTSSG